MFEKRVRSRIFGSKWDRVAGKWRRLHTEELYDRYRYSGFQIMKKNEMGGAFGTYGGEELCVRGFGWKT